MGWQKEAKNIVLQSEHYLLATARRNTLKKSSPSDGEFVSVERSPGILYVKVVTEIDILKVAAT